MAKRNKIRREELEIVYASDLRQSGDFDWNDFSFGDASFTLVEPEKLIAEVMCAPGHLAGVWKNLLEDLRIVPEGCFVAFNG